jgi:thiol-disulfide isomerase/thioredoxin
VSIKETIAREVAVLVYFKNDSCAPCMALRPKVEELLKEHFPEVKFILVDSVQNPQLNGEFQVFANPTLLVFFDGKEYIRKSKYVSIPELQAEIGRLYGMMFG